LIAGLFADQHQVCMFRAGAEHGLCGMLPERAALAGGSFGRQSGDRWRGWAVRRVLSGEKG